MSPRIADEVLAQTSSSDHDSADVSVLQQLDRASKELEVVQYRVQLIQGDLELESDIQLGSGGAPLEDELEALEEQLENTLRAREAAEDKLRRLTGKNRAGWRESDGGGPMQERYDSVDFTRANHKTDPGSRADVQAISTRDTTVSRKCRAFQRV